MATEISSIRSRRAILLGALGGVAAAAAAVVERADPVSATNGDTVHVGHTYTASVTTKIVGTGSVVETFTGVGEGTSTGLYGVSQSGVGVSGTGDRYAGVAGQSHRGWGVLGESGLSYGVFGHTLNGKVGVFGLSDSGTGIGVYGRGMYAGVHGRSILGDGVFGQAEAGAGVYGTATGTGMGVAGSGQEGTGVNGYSDSGIGVQGQTNSASKPGVRGLSLGNAGVQGYSGTTADVSSSPSHTGVFGSADGVASAVGVKGASSTGRGGLFSGNLAQLRLVPSNVATHPDSGSAGDFFVDASHRLWYCQGGATWKRLD
jgi:hypothetical protein